MEKVKLRNHDDGSDIVFMYNPKELSLKEAVETSDNPGARSQRSGRPKVSFSNLPAKTITISNILFDTFETKENVVEIYIKKFQAATRFINGLQRPPVYCLTWGKEEYLEYCFVESVSYKLTKFLQDGTPVRAIIDTLTLKETEKPNDDASSTPNSQPDPANDNMKNRQKTRS